MAEEEATIGRLTEREARGLVAVVTRDLPEPLADAGAAYFAEIGVSEPDWFRAFHRLIDAFEAAVSYSAMLAALCYVHSSVRTPAASQAIETLRDQPQLSTGFWWYLLRECLRAFEGQRELLFCPELYELYFRSDGRAGTEAKLLDAVPGLRNRLRGHAFTLPIVRYRSVAQEQSPVLEGLFHRLSPLARYPLARVLAVRPAPGGGCLADLEFRVGTAYRPVCQVVRLAGEVPVGEVLMLGESNSPEGRPFLSLHPFVVHHPLNDELGVSELALFQGRDGERASYLAVRTGTRFEVDRVGSLVVKSLAAAGPLSDPARALRSADGRLLVADLVDAASAVTDQFIATARLERIYVPEAFVERSRVQAHVRASIDGPARLIILTGRAGAGKTSLLCRLAEELRASCQRDAILLVPASNLPVSREPLADAIAKLLGLGTELRQGLLRWESVAWPENRRGRIILLVDGLERADDDDELLRALAGLCGAHESLEAVITIASPVLEGLSLRDRIPDVPWLYRSVEGAAGGRAIPVTPLDSDEVAAAYERYRSMTGTSPNTPSDQLAPTLRAAMTNPLLLRLTCEVYDRKDIPRDATEVDVLIEHARRTAFADPARQDFVRRLVRKMATGRRRRVPLRELLDDAFTRPAILATDGPYRGLLRDQVLVELYGRSAGIGLAPETYVEFAFDAMLGYLLLLDALDQPGATLAGVVSQFATAAAEFSPAAVALDVALRSAHVDERRVLVGKLLTEGNPDLSSIVVARFIEWMDGPTPAPFRVVLASRLGTVAAGHRNWDAEIEKELDALLGPREPEPQYEELHMPAVVFVADLFEQGAVPAERLLDVSRALSQRRSHRLAALVAEQLLSRSFDELPGVRRREAELIVALALRQEGSDQALRAAAMLLEETRERAIAAGHVGHRVQTSELLARTLFALNQPERAAAFFDEVVELLRPKGDTTDLLRTLTQKAETLLALNRTEAVQESLQESRALSDRVQDSHARAEVARVTALVEANPAERVRLLREALDLFKASGNIEREAVVLAELSAQLLEQGQLNEAERLARNALTTARMLAASEVLLEAMYGLFRVAWARGNFEEATHLLRERGRLARSLGRLPAVQKTFHALSLLAYEQGDVSGASRFDEVERSILASLARAGLDVREQERLVLSNLSESCAILGEPERAVILAEEALRVGQDMTIPLPLAESNLSVALARLGNPSEALPHGFTARDQARTYADRQGLIESGWALAEIYLLLERPQDAVSVLQEEVAVCEANGERLQAAGMRARLALALQATGALEEALATAEVALSAYRDDDRVREKYRATFAVARALEAMAASAEAKRATRLRGRARKLLERAGAEVEAEAAVIDAPQIRSSFLRRNPLVRSIRQSLGLADADDSVGLSENEERTHADALISVEAPDSDDRSSSDGEKVMHRS